MRYIRVGVICTGVLALAFSLTVHSAVYKCRDVQGRISYSQSVCPEEAVVDKIIKLRGSRRANDHDVQCGLVNSFAAEVGIAINKNQSLNDFYRKFGGERQIPPTALSIIRSVYEYQSQPYKTLQNSVEYEEERCRSEVYGVPSCSDFPVKFITDYGGCSQAANADLRLKRMSASSSADKLKSDSNKAKRRVASATKAAEQRYQQGGGVQACESLRMSLRRNEAEAQSATTPYQKEQLTAERGSLRERFSQCSQ